MMLLRFYIIKRQLKSSFFTLILLFFLSCKEVNVSPVVQANPNQELIVEADVRYSKGGVAKARIQGDTILRYTDKQMQVFTAGILIDAYTPQETIEARLTADSAVYYEITNEAYFYKNVLVINLIEHDTMWAEDLVVKLNQDSIYTKHPMHLKTKKENIFGSSFHSDLRFKQKVVSNPTGYIKVAKTPL